jgi:hypothetical protein
MIGRIIPVFILMGALALFFGHVQPQFNTTIAGLRAKIAGYDKALDAAKQFKEKQDALKDQQSAISQEDQMRIAKFLPDGVDNVQLIVDLNALASRSGVRLSDFNVERDEGKELEAGRLASEGQTATQFLDITVRGIATYSSFRTFLDGVERSLRPMDLVGLTLANSETGVYSYDMTFRIYWLR